MDETDLPTEEMFEAAFNFRHKKLFHLCYGYLEIFNFLLLIVFSIIGHGLNIIYLLEKKIKLYCKSYKELDVIMFPNMVMPSLLNGIYPSLLRNNILIVSPTLVTNVFTLVTNGPILATTVLTLVTTVLADTYNYSVMKRKRREKAFALLIKLFQLHIKKTLF